MSWAISAPSSGNALCRRVRQEGRKACTVTSPRLWNFASDSNRPDALARPSGKWTQPAPYPAVPDRSKLYQSPAPGKLPSMPSSVCSGQSSQRISGSLRPLGTRGGAGSRTACGWPTMIGATGAHVAGMPSALFPSGVLKKVCEKPIQQAPSPIACAASIRFSAANAQSSTINGTWAILELTISTGAR